MKLNIVFIGLSITSSWGNGHATTYRALLKALADRGHSVTFLERDVSWYSGHRDLPRARFCRIGLYRELNELPVRFGALIRTADLVVLGSYVPDGAAIADWIATQARGITAFYDIDTPVTLAGLEAGRLDYLTPSLVPRFDLYLSFSGGPALAVIEREFGARRARPLYCSADPDVHVARPLAPSWLLGYLGTYCADRQPALEEFLFTPARALPEAAFAVAGSQYPPGIEWPPNVARLGHSAPADHSDFYGGQRFTLNLTRANMKTLGYSPSVRLFEAAACGSAVISDSWPGLATIFEPGREILVAQTSRDVLAMLTEISDERRMTLAENARKRLLRDHTPGHRARELESYYSEAAEDNLAPVSDRRMVTEA